MDYFGEIATNIYIHVIYIHAIYIHAIYIHGIYIHDIYIHGIYDIYICIYMLFWKLAQGAMYFTNHIRSTGSVFQASGTHIVVFNTTFLQFNI